MALNVNLTFDLVVTLTHLHHPPRAHHPNSLPSVTDEVSHSIGLVTRNCGRLCLHVKNARSPLRAR